MVLLDTLQVFLDNLIETHWKITHTAIEKQKTVAAQPMNRNSSTL